MNLTPKRKELLEKRGIVTDKDMVCFFPRKYKDYTTVYKRVEPSMEGKEGCFIGTMDRLSSKPTANGCTNVSFKLILEDGQKINVNNFGKAYLKKAVEYLEGKESVITGKLHYDTTYGYSVNDPDDIASANKVSMVKRMVPVYTKISGISEDAMGKLRKEAFALTEFESKRYSSAMEDLCKGLPAFSSAVKMVHYPEKAEDVELAKKRVDYEDLYEFVVESKKKSKERKATTFTKVRTFAKTKAIMDGLPYSLTKDQNDVCKDIFTDIRGTKRISSLVVGDVGCGKSIVAFLTLIAMAENGYQGVIMAPTTILAKQHYDELKVYADKVDLNVEFYDGSLSAKAKKDVIKRVEAGEVDILVGTQALCNADVNYKSLGFVVIDEEHRFGVAQREALTKYAKDGVNTMMMSATPIPRSYAEAMYGTEIKIYQIKTMPSCRIPIQTAINNSQNVIYDFIEKQLKEGRQAYVVCPLIEANEDSEAMKDVISVNDRFTAYQKRFEPEYKVAILNGKMKKEEVDQIINDYKDGNIKILISTTVVEVGVNVPNASVMVISNAERFGLATMHQLRGRVGRGAYKSYCILQSAYRENERLHAMVQFSSGFDIAERDLLLRGAGDLVGTRQSGFTRTMELVIRYHEEYEKLMKEA